jgi:antitoxin MazE
MHKNSYSIPSLVFELVCNYNVIMSTRPTSTPKTIAKLTKIGNSRGVRLPKALIEQAGLKDEVELIARDGEILIANHRKPREGWEESFEGMAEDMTAEDWAWVDAKSLPDEIPEDEGVWWE